MAAALEKELPSFFTRMVPPMPEVIHASLLCGESPWWIDTAIFFEGDVYSAGITVMLPGHTYDEREYTAEELLLLWRETCARRDTPDVDEYDNPFGGQEPGSWDWDD